MPLRNLITAWLTVAMLGSTPAWADAKTDATLAEGRKASELFLQRNTARLWAQMTPDMQAALQSAAGLAQFRASIDNQLGTEQTILTETTSEQAGARIYLRTSRWSKAPMPIAMQWAFNTNNQIAGFYVRPAPPPIAESPYKDYQTKATLRLPFEGEWLVVWGGRTQEQNYHIVARDQRYAYDLLKTADGKTHKGDGKQLSDYYCWNQKILAPAKGTVVEVIDGLPDQAIGTTNAQAPAGNHVMLDLGQGEYALLAHLQQGSVKVKLGDKVTSGEELGRCGNSGNTSEPHLHFHLQDKPKFGEGDGMPAFISGYVVEGKWMNLGELVKGQKTASESKQKTL
ncbi:M23 family metallopeptidase [Chitinimonas naiadis]